MNESEIQTRIMIALSEMGCTIWRNNTGAYKDGNRYIRYGLAKGSSDLIGLTKCGRFLAVEVKRPGQKPTNDQINFINHVTAKNGVAFVAYSVDDAINKLRERMNGFS